MKKRRLLRLFEHERIVFGEGLSLTQTEVDRLETLNGDLAGHGKKPVLSFTYKNGRAVSMQAHSMVGVLRAGGVSVQVMPKLAAGTDDSSRSLAVGNLLQMLEKSGWVNISRSGITGLGADQDDFFEVLISLYANGLLEMLNRGVVRRYVNLEAVTPYLKGRLLFPDTGSRGAARHLFRVSHDEFSEDNQLNQVFKRVTSLLIKLSSNGSNVKLLIFAEYLLSNVRDRAVTAHEAEKITLGRFDLGYGPLLELAKIFLSGSSTRLGHGRFETFSFLLDMNVLFEKYVGKVVQEVLGTSFSVLLQKPQRHLAYDVEMKKDVLSLRPDITVWSRKGKGSMIAPLLIADTKYKILDNDERASGVSHGDLYQMLAYAKRYGGDRILLMYPKELNGRVIRKHLTVGGDGSNVSVFVATVDLLKNLKWEYASVRREVQELVTTSMH